jgi:hypothetical protein
VLCAGEPREWCQYHGGWRPESQFLSDTMSDCQIGQRP